MGTFKRLNDQQKQQAQAEAAMPGAYENRYDEGIQNALAGMDSANSAGLGFDSQNGTYRGALSRLFGNADAGASAAEQVANSLSGGYGTDWAKSAAQQAAAGETGQTANVYAQARADALSQWQQELAGQGTQLNNLLSQDQLARNEHDGSVQNAADWRSYRYDRTQQARQENSDFLNNVWNVVKNVGAAALEGYDAYKGYRQQDWENAFALRQYNDNLSRTELSDQMAALQQAASYKEAGFDDAAKQILNQYGLTDTMLDSWQGLSQVDKDKLDYLTTAAGLAGSGYDTAANNYLQMAGLPAGSVDSYSTIANRLNQADLAKYASQLAISNRYKTTGTGSGTGRSTKSTKSSGSRGKTGTGFTNTQLQTMATKFQNMKNTDPLYPFYKQTLTDAGWLTPTGTGSGSGTAARSGSTGSKLAGVLQRGSVYGTVKPVDGTNGNSFDTALSRAQSMTKQGKSADEIAASLIRLGFGDDVISRVSNTMGW